VLGLQMGHHAQRACAFHSFLIIMFLRFFFFLIYLLAVLSCRISSRVCVCVNFFDPLESVAHNVLSLIFQGTFPKIRNSSI
jgi:hypothetical protein